MLVLAAFGMFVISVLTSIYGPQRWLFVSALTALSGGIALGFSRPDSLWDQVAASTCFGLFFMVSIVSIGWKVRRDRGTRLRRD